MILDFKYTAPTTIEEAASNIGKIFLAGGTDIVPLMKYEVRLFDEVVNLGKITELKYIKTCEKGALIGAMATLTEIEQNDSVRKMFPALAFSAKCVASPQIRNIGTIGGNLMQDRRCLFFNQSYEWRQSIVKCFKTGGEKCHQAPVSPVCRAPYYSDMATALYAYGAKVSVITKNGAEKMCVTKLLENHGKLNGRTDLDNLLLTEIEIDNTSVWSKFIKESVRDTIDFPTFNACINVYNDNVDTKVRIAVGAITMHPVMLEKTMALINDNIKNITAVAAQVQKTAAEEVKAACVIVREDVISPKIKRDTFASLEDLIAQLIKYLG